MPQDYFIQYGLSAFVGRFASSREHARGEAVVIGSPRGEERGIVLCAAQLPGPCEGNILDEAEAWPQPGSLETIIEEANRTLSAAAMPAMILDAEELRDGTAILHVMSWAEVDLTNIVEELIEQSGRPIRLHHLQPAPTEKEHDHEQSCGKDNCGSGGCSTGGGCGTTGGCGTSSCSRGSVKSSQELTDHFVRLREAMEAEAKTRRSLSCAE